MVALWVHKSIPADGEQVLSREMIVKSVKSASGFLTWGNLRDLSIVVFLFVCAYRFAVVDIVIDLSGFNFTDLLSMILAISVIALSAAFYFKADESSKGFYNNTYHFTKDVSEILGRIEAGFGEKLRHIDEGYNGLNEKFDRMPFDRVAAKAGEVIKEAEIQEQEAIRQDILEDLMKRAKLADEEKQEFVEKLSQLSDELDRSRSELASFRIEAELDEDNFGVSSSFVKYIMPFLSRHYPSAYKSAPQRVIINRFGRVLADEEFDTHDTGYMEQHGLLRDGRLTEKGYHFVKGLLGRI